MNTTQDPRLADDQDVREQTNEVVPRRNGNDKVWWRTYFDLAERKARKLGFGELPESSWLPNWRIDELRHHEALPSVGGSDE